MEKQEFEKNKVATLFDICQTLDTTFTNTLLASTKGTLYEQLKTLLKMIAEHIKDLRHVLIGINSGRDKFLTLSGSSGSNLEKSKFAPVISSLKVAKYDVTQAISSGLRLTNEVCYNCALSNECEHLYSFSGIVDLT